MALKSRHRAPFVVRIASPPSTPEVWILLWLPAAGALIVADEDTSQLLLITNHSREFIPS